MKKIRKLIAVLLCIAMVCGIVPSVTVFASYDEKTVRTLSTYTPTSEAYQLTEYLNNKVGTTFSSNACQAFVYQSLYNCLGVSNTKTSCCATKAWQNYGVSSQRDNIPLGAAVYFAGSSVTDSVCGQKAGHVGLYVGDGYIVHAWSSKIKKQLSIM